MPDYKSSPARLGAGWDGLPACNAWSRAATSPQQKTVFLPPSPSLWLWEEAKAWELPSQLPPYPTGRLPPPLTLGRELLVGDTQHQLGHQLRTEVEREKSRSVEN